jgi:hypothetical protein
MMFNITGTAVQNGIVVCDLNCGTVDRWFYTKLNIFLQTEQTMIPEMWEV